MHFGDHIVSAIVNTVLLIIHTPVLIVHVTEIYFSVPEKPPASKSIRIPAITFRVLQSTRQTSFG